MKKKLNKYSVMVKIVLDTDVEILAENLEDALEKSATYDIDDLIDIKGSHNDSKMEVTGVYKHD